MNVRHWLLSALLIPILVLVQITVCAGKQRALVIGVDNYANIQSLQRAVGDANAIGAELQRIGFDDVTVLSNPGRTEINWAIIDLQNRTSEGDTILFHFSGHGVQVDSENYLLPKDTPLLKANQKDLLRDEAISLSGVFRRLDETAAGTRIIIIDACRDNPFAMAGTRGIGSDRGMKPIEPSKGTFIMYSASTGQVALDRLGADDKGQTSVFTRVLLKHLSRPGVEITDIAQDVRTEVEGLAYDYGYQQRPAYYDELSSRFMLIPNTADPDPAPKTANPDPVPKAAEPNQESASLEPPSKIEVPKAKKPVTGNPIVVATAGPMTGEYAALGEQLKHGAEQAVADINSKGGVLGRKVILEIGDDACDVEQAVTVANQLVAKGVTFVAGHVCSGSSISASKVYKEKNVLQISPASRHPRFTDEGGWNTNRVVNRDDRQGRFAGEYLASHFKGQRIGLIYEKSDFGSGLAGDIIASLGISNIALTTTFDSREEKYPSIVSAVRKARIQVLYIAAFPRGAALIARDLREANLQVQIIGSYALSFDNFWTTAGPAGEGVLFSFPREQKTYPEAQGVMNDLRSRGWDAEGDTLSTYAAFQVWAQAVEASGTDDSKTVSQMMRSGRSFDTVIGTISFDEKGDVRNNQFAWYVWRKGRYVESPENN